MTPTNLRGAVLVLLTSSVLAPGCDGGDTDDPIALDQGDQGTPGTVFRFTEDASFTSGTTLFDFTFTACASAPDRDCRTKLIARVLPDPKLERAIWVQVNAERSTTMQPSFMYGIRCDDAAGAATSTSAPDSTILAEAESDGSIVWNVTNNPGDFHAHPEDADGWLVGVEEHGRGPLTCSGSIFIDGRILALPTFESIDVEVAAVSTYTRS